MPRKKSAKKIAAQDKTLRIVGQLSIIVIAVFIALSLFTDATGPLGEDIGVFLKGILGFCAYILPVLLIVSAISLMAAKEIRNTRVRIWLAAVAILSLSVFLHIFSASAFAYKGITFSQLVVTLYQSGIESQSGGVIGGLICTPLLMLFDKIGTAIIIGFILAVSTVLTLGSFFAKVKRVLFPFTAQELGDTVAQALPKRREREEQIPLPARKLKSADKPVAVVVGAGSISNADRSKAAIRDIPIEDPIHAQVDVDKVMDALSSVDVESTPTGAVSPAQPSKAAMPAVQGSMNKTLGEEAVLPPTYSDEFANYRLPDLSLLKTETRTLGKGNEIELRATAKKLVETLSAFGVNAKVQNISRGPSVTRYELTPAPGVKISRITTLSEDIALALKASAVRIEAPIPGKGTIGIEVANKEITPINIRRLLATEEFAFAESRLCTALGLDISGSAVLCDLAQMPHLLIAGTTGSGKSVCINVMLMSILFKARPDEVKMILIDPKRIELDVYNGIPHLISPVVTDPKKAAGALKWAVGEMQNRYKLFSELGARNIQSYNEQAKKRGEKCLPSILIVIDELSDIMMCAPHEVEDAICRIAQMARAAGMYLAIATQRPSVDVVTGLIKANIPSRIAFAVESQVNSRIILDMGGAEKLLGKGDMLYLPIGRSKPLRLQGCWVSDEEISNVVSFIKSSSKSDYDEKVIEQIEKNATDTQALTGGENSREYDEVLTDAVEVFVDAGMASVSLLQRRLKLGYARAARIVDEMEELGIVGPYEGSKPRQILISRTQWQEMRMNMEK